MNQIRCKIESKSLNSFIYEFTTNIGIFRSTSKHEHLTDNGFVRAEDLNVNDTVILPEKIFDWNDK